MRIVHFSDWHGDKCELPPGDLYICTGDMLKDYPEKIGKRQLRQGKIQITMDDTWINPRRQVYYQARDVRDNNYRDLLGTPEAPVVVCRGNHDFVSLAGLFDGGAVYEIGKSITTFQIGDLIVGGVRGIRYIAGEWSDEIREPDIDELFERLPYTLDILVTHAPPYGMMDGQPNFAGRPARYGVKGLGNYMTSQFYHQWSAGEKKLKLHCFGHIHEGFGQRVDGDVSHRICFSNAATGFSVFELDGDIVRVLRMCNNPFKRGK